MLIVDAQIHIWSSGKPSNLNHRQVPVYSKDDALAEMAAAGVDAAIIHPPASWDPNANELAVEAARQHPDRFAILGNFPLDRPESRALVDGWKRRPGMLGLRFVFLQEHQRSWPTDGTIDWLWPAAERAGLPVALHASLFMPTVGKVAEKYPRLKLIVDHLGRTSGDQGRRRVGQLARDAGAGEVPQRRGQGHRRAELFQRAVPLPEHPRPPAPHLRRLRPRAPVLGHRHHPHALLVAAVRDPLHRGAALAHGARPGARHGARRVRVARLESPSALRGL